MQQLHDVLILGGGAAGYTAALYAARAGLDTLVLEGTAAGGQLTQARRIDNYPGFDTGVDGDELARKMRLGAEKYGARTEFARLHATELHTVPKRVRSDAGDLFARTVILATGAEPRPLGLPGERALTGRGLSYCASCDGELFRGRRVAVIGGGNTAASEALALARIASEVLLLHRGTELRATRLYHAPVDAARNITRMPGSEVIALLESGGRLQGLRVKTDDGVHDLQCDGAFVCIGRRPATDCVRGQLALDAAGYVIAGENGTTSLPGVFAAGDVRAKPLRQLVTAVADGANAAFSAERYLNMS